MFINFVRDDITNSMVSQKREGTVLRLPVKEDIQNYDTINERTTKLNRQEERRDDGTKWKNGQEDDRTTYRFVWTP